jgi:serine protease Do
MFSFKGFIFLTSILACWQGVIANADGAKKETSTVEKKDDKVDKSSDKKKFAIDAFSFEHVAEKVLNSVVSVTVQQQQSNESSAEDDVSKKFKGTPFEDFFKNFSFGGGGKARKVMVSGSGFFIRVEADRAFIATNSHIVENYSKVKVLFGKVEFPATVHGFDPRSDIAILLVNRKDVPKEVWEKIEGLQWGDSDEAKVGQWVIAVGNPFGLGNTVTAGIISAKSRDLRTGSNSLNDDFLQHSAQINVGNSGGCLVNMAGEVIGINTVIITPSGGNVGIGFAIPSATARKVANQLIEDKEIKRGALGIKVQDFTEEMAEGLGTKYKSGAVVAYVDPVGPAFKAGIEVGDVIVQFDDVEVTGMKKLSKIVGDAAVNSVHKVKLIRGKEEKVVDVTLCDYNNINDTSDKEKTTRASEDVVKVLGMSLADVSEHVRVTKVEPDSAADDVGITPGDCIEEVNQEVIKSATEFKEKVATAIKNKVKFVFIRVRKDDTVRFVSMKIDEEEAPKKSEDGKKDEKADQAQKEDDASNGEATENEDENKDEQHGSNLGGKLKEAFSNFGGIIDGFFDKSPQNRGFFR